MKESQHLKQNILLNEIYKEGHHGLCHPCNCGRDLKIGFDYELEHQILEHDGPGPEAKIEETVRFKTDAPRAIECIECGYVYLLEIPPISYYKMREPEIDEKTGKIVKSADPKPEYDPNGADESVQTKLDEIVFVSLKKPLKV